MYVNEIEVRSIKERYQAGKRIKLICIGGDEKFSIAPGTEGTIRKVDDIGAIHVNWDNGRGLGLAHGVDTYELI